MSDALFSSSWYRVASLRPALRVHTRLHRHLYRGERWYVLHDAANQRTHRLSNTAHHLIGLMDGARTLGEIWEHVAEQLGDDAPTQDEVIHLLGTLHAADALASGTAPDLQELFSRRRRRESQELWQRLLAPLALRIPIADPDRLLTRFEPWVRFLFTRWVAGAWCGLVALAAFLGVVHFEELVARAGEQLLSPGNLILLAVVYPLMKAVHELGHAFASKTWGCEVHEVGVLFLVLLPVPYVDASAAAVLPDKRRRMVVGAAGIMVEAGLASLALLVWLAVDPGVVSSIAYNVIWIGGVSTLLFNGNPLLRFDGYFVLSDALEIPNLADRAQQFIKAWVDRRVFKLANVRDPATAESERPWLLVYGCAAALYRLFITFAIALFVAGKLFFFGVLLALFSLATQLVIPAAKMLAGLFTDPRFGDRRRRALLVSAGAVAALVLGVGAIPFPHWTAAEGVVWPPEEAHVRVGVAGFVMEILVEPHSIVAPGDPLLRTRDPTLEARVASLQARVRELRARRHAERLDDLVRSQITAEEIITANAELESAQEEVRDVIVRSPAAGAYVPLGGRDWIGRFVAQGELVGYVVGPAAKTVRVVVSGEDVALVRNNAKRVELRASSRLGDVARASINREVPAGIDELPSRALGSAGGGVWPVDPTDPNGGSSPAPVFQFDLVVEEPPGFARIGERVYVRFFHDPQPIAPRVARSIRRLFLGRFRV